MAARSRTKTLAALVKFQDSLHDNDSFAGIRLESSLRGLRSSPVTFYCLPDEQYRHSQSNVARPFQERHGESDFGADAEQGRENCVSGFLCAEGMRNEDGCTSGRGDHAFDRQYGREGNPRPDQSKWDPATERAGHPSNKMKHQGEANSCARLIDRFQRSAYRCGSTQSAGQNARREFVYQTVSMTLQSQKHAGSGDGKDQTDEQTSRQRVRE